MDNGLWLGGILWVQWWVQYKKQVMRNKHSKTRHIRLDDDTWEQFKVEQRKSGKSWNLFIKDINEHKKDYERNSISKTNQRIPKLSRAYGRPHQQRRYKAHQRE